MTKATTGHPGWHCPWCDLTTAWVQVYFIRCMVIYWRRTFSCKN